MAAPKKKVTKDDLKRFMKDKTLIKSTVKRIEHPLAKYNTLDQLVCILCNNVIKNDFMWNAHLQSKQHKERTLALKTQGPAKPAHLETVTSKRKSEDNSTINEKKRKSNLASDLIQNEAHKKETKEKAKAAFLAGYSSSDESSEEADLDKEKEESRVSSSKETPTVKGLPSDFFDAGYEPSTSSSEDGKQSKPESSQNKKMSDILPEGFFDDPKMDAKVRNVEYKDKMEEEWDLFQKAVKEEAKVSEVIMEEDDEQANLDRNIDEIDDQIQRWQEVENLHVKKETIVKNLKDGQKDDDSDEELDDEELNQFSEWRAKKVMK